jgi:hypothetical protein
LSHPASSATRLRASRSALIAAVRPDDDGWDAVEAELFAALPPKHTVYYVTIRIDDDRRHDAVFADDPGELSLLGAIMGAHRTLRRAEVVDRAFGDLSRRTGRIHRTDSISVGPASRHLARGFCAKAKSHENPGLPAGRRPEAQTRTGLRDAMRKTIT